MIYDCERSIYVLPNNDIAGEGGGPRPAYCILCNVMHSCAFKLGGSAKFPPGLSKTARKGRVMEVLKGTINIYIPYIDKSGGNEYHQR